jgi:hypothetical protein
MAVLTVVLLAALPACTEEVISVRGNSLAGQFEQLNKNGWNVGTSDANHSSAHKSLLDDPNVRVIKGADFSAVKFNTSFQIDDPKLKAQTQDSQAQNQAPANAGSSGAPGTMLPFGPAPNVNH